MMKRESDDPPASAADTELISNLASSRDTSAAVARFGDDPLTFLLDSVSDAVNLWSAEGELLYRNRASGTLDTVIPAPAASRSGTSDIESLNLLGRRFERRYLRCHIERQDYFLEVIRDVR